MEKKYIILKYEFSDISIIQSKIFYVKEVIYEQKRTIK